MSSPTHNHLQAVKRILKYLQGTLHYGIAFTPDPISLSAYSDVDWAGDPVDKRSITGIVVFLGNSPITLSVKKQCIVSCSSTKAEYHALASTAAELYWIRMLLRDFGIFLPQPPLLWCDRLLTLCIMLRPSTLRLIITLFVRKSSGVICLLNSSPLMINLLICLPRVFLLWGLIGLLPNSCGNSSFVLGGMKALVQNIQIM